MQRLIPHPSDDIDVSISPETELIDYTPENIDEYLVIVNDDKDWIEIHDFIINENEIDGIPNRKIECANSQEYSLRSSVYLMSVEEAEILKNHPKVESVQLNPDKYPQPQSLMTMRYKKPVAFNKPRVPANINGTAFIEYTNNVRSNWSHLFVNQQSSEPFRGVGIDTARKVDFDISYSLTGKGVDAVIIDSGVSYLHPEFIGNDGKTRVKDVILDGPYKVDPEYFESNGYTYQKFVDGIDVGVGIATTAAHEWWSNSSSRSSKFQNIGVISITSSYTLEHVSTKSSNIYGNQIIDGHGTACASQIAGKNFGLAFDANIWNIRIALSGVGGYISGSTALNICAIWNNAKKISTNNPDPTLINNSWGSTFSTGNTLSTVYTHGYRNSTLTYTGTGSASNVPSNSGACRNHKYFTFNTYGFSQRYTYTGSGQYIPVDVGSTTNSAAENAISSGCIVVSAAGNNNQKLSDHTDLDYNNWYSTSTNYINRVGGVQKGFVGLDERTKGVIRVGALDCGVEPVDSKQGAEPYSIRKVCYSANGPMISLWAPAEMTMAAGYTGSYEDYVRNDDSNFYDTWFNGTSSAAPNACSVIALFLQSYRKATQRDTIYWLDNHGTIESYNLSDPYDDPTETGYWSISYNSSLEDSSELGDSYNSPGNGNLRGATRKVLHNPFSSGIYETQKPSTSIEENVAQENIGMHLDARSTFSTDLSGNNITPNSFSGNIYDGNSYELTAQSYNVFSGAITSNLSITSNSFVMESWIYYSGSSITGNYGQIFTQDSGGFDGGNGWQWRISNSTNNIEFVYWTSSSRSSAVSITSNTQLQYGNWYHLAVSYDKTTIKMFLDGVVDYTHTPSLPLYGSISAIGIGMFNRSSIYSDILNGKIATIRVYKNTHLSDKKIQNNFLTQRGRYYSDFPLSFDGLSIS